MLNMPTKSPRSQFGEAVILKSDVQSTGLRLLHAASNLELTSVTWWTALYGMSRISQCCFCGVRGAILVYPDHACSQHNYHC